MNEQEQTDEQDEQETVEEGFVIVSKKDLPELQKTGREILRGLSLVKSLQTDMCTLPSMLISYRSIL